MLLYMPTPCGKILKFPNCHADRKDVPIIWHFHISDNGMIPAAMRTQVLGAVFASRQPRNPRAAITYVIWGLRFGFAIAE